MSDILFQPLGDPIAAGEGLEHIADIDPRMTRTHYFDGRLLTAEDLTRDQIYLDQRLREMGRVLGSGVIDGLELSFDRFTGLLTLSPGQAMTSAGRVLELGSQLIVSLGDRALIAGNNDGQFRRFNRALYAVVLRYVEVATDIAEVFPTDLASKRGSQYAMITESVQMGLTPLPIPLPQQDPLHIRANLMRELLGNSQVHGLIPEDGVALGILAIQNDTPQWLDAELLRRPLRSEADLDDLQQDLSRQYERLLADVLAKRLSGSLNNDFAAREYFSLLPPVGSIPKDTIDPASGRQDYFPENFNVSIAPIRRSDVDLIKAESMPLPNIDLSSSEPVDIVVLTPLSNQDYGHYALQLEREYDPSLRRLPQIDLLRLKLYPVRPVHKLDTDEDSWRSIWERLGDENPFYVRRPTRAAETAISGIVLAQGARPPLPPVIVPVPDAGDAGSDTTEIPSPAPTASDSGGLIEDEGSVFLRFVNFKHLASLRPPTRGEAQDALEKLQNIAGEDAAQVQLAMDILLLIERQFDPVIWQTLLELTAAGTGKEFLNGLMQADPTIPRVKQVVELGSQLGLNNTLLNQWIEVSEQRL